MKRALLLNASWEPLHFISDERALVLLYKGTAELVTSASGGTPSVWNEKYASVSKSFDAPATIRLLRRVNKAWRPPRFRKKVLFNRDGWKCQYCSEDLTWESITIDHVQPKSRGGSTSWKNCVASCKTCNRKKANRTPSEAGMLLKKQPADPTPFHYWDFSRHTAWHPDWDAFLQRDA